MSTNDQKTRFIELWLLPFCIGGCIAIGYWVSLRGINSKSNTFTNASSRRLQEGKHFLNKKTLKRESFNKRFQIKNIEEITGINSRGKKNVQLKNNRQVLEIGSENQASKIENPKGKEDDHLSPNLFFTKYSLDRIIQSLPNPKG